MGCHQCVQTLWWGRGCDFIYPFSKVKYSLAPIWQFTDLHLHFLCLFKQEQQLIFIATKNHYSCKSMVFMFAPTMTIETM